MNDDQVQGKSLDDRIAEATSTDTAGEIENQPEPMPSSEQKQTEELPPTDEASTDEEQLPEDTSERTKKNFEKIREENRRLKEQLEQFGNSVFDSFRPQQVAEVNTEAFGNLNQHQVDSIKSQFVDEDGNVDINGLNQALTQANQRAAAAEAEARKTRESLERFEESQQVREAHAVHPWLNPKDPNFDPVRFEMVRDRILRVKYYEGQPITLLEAADLVAQASGGASPVDLDKVSEEAVKKYKENQVKRQQGPIETGKGEPRDTQDFNELREKTRFENPSNDSPALEERLRNLGILSKNT